MAALLSRHVPLLQADQALREGHWHYFAGRPGALRTELGSQTIGLLGFGHIAKTLAHRAKAFGMRVVVANRSPVQSTDVDASFGLDNLNAFMGSCDALVVTLPLTDNTKGLVNAQAIQSMRRDAILINVGRGAVIDESALYEALKNQVIAGALIDTWVGQRARFKGENKRSPTTSIDCGQGKLCSTFCQTKRLGTDFF